MILIISLLNNNIIIIYIVNIVISIYILVSYITIKTNCLDNNPPPRAAEGEKKWAVFCPNCHALLFSFRFHLDNQPLTKTPLEKRYFQRVDKGQSMQ